MPFKEEAIKAAADMEFEERFCSKCKHSYKGGDSDLWPMMCGRPNREQKRDMTTGDLLETFCSVERQYDNPGLCGKDGKFFEPKSADLLIDQKSFLWWTARKCHERYMFHENKERGWNSAIVFAAQKDFYTARDLYVENYGTFYVDDRPKDVSENCPSGVDRSL